MGYQDKESFPVFASAARTAAHDSSDFTCPQHKGMRLKIAITAIVSTPAVTFTIQGKDKTSGLYYDMLASAALGTAGVVTDLVIYPGCVAVNNRVANLPMPETWRVRVTVGDSDSATYSVDAEYLP